MFLDFYRLREQPFGVTPNPRYLYHSPAHREALASLIYGIEADLGFAALIAEPGMGKTTLLFYLLEKFRTSARTALVFQTQCTRLELLRYLAKEFEVASDSEDPVVLNERLLEVMVNEARAGRRVILIIDEAQNLSEDVLEAVRLLSDFETPDAKLLHIILAGQPQLAEKLARPSLAQLLQRISMLNRLNPLTSPEIKNYIEYRLGVAGYRGAMLFTPDAIEVIARLSGGVPRKINRVCFNALSLGCALKQRLIDASVIEEVGSDLDIGELLYENGVTSADIGGIQEIVSQQAVNLPQQSPKPAWTPVPAHVPVSAGQPLSSETRTASAKPTSAPARPAPTWAAAPASIKPATRAAVPAPVKPSVPAARPAPAPMAKPRQANPARDLQNRPLVSSANRRLVLTGIVAAALILAGWAVKSLPAHTSEAARPVPAAQDRNGADQSLELPEAEAKPESGQDTKTSSRSARRQPAEHVKVTSPAVTPAKPISQPSQSEPDSGTPDATEPPASAPQNEMARAETNSMMVDFGPQTTPKLIPGRASRGVIPAALLRRVQPIYPPAAQQAGIEGTVVVAAVIAKDGHPKNVRALSGHSVLAQAAVDAVRKWVYRPYLLNGQPTDVDTQVVINFGLSADGR